MCHAVGMSHIHVISDKWRKGILTYSYISIVITQYNSGQITRKHPADVSFSDNFGGKVTGSQSSGVTRDHQEEPHGHLVETKWPDKVGQIRKIYFTTDRAG